MLRGMCGQVNATAVSAPKGKVDYDTDGVWMCCGRIVGCSEVVRSVFASLLVQRPRVSRIAVFRRETGRRKIIISCRAIAARRTGVTIKFWALQVLERKSLWQPDL